MSVPARARIITLKKMTMKKKRIQIFIFVIIGIALITNSCKKDHNNAGGIVIKGQIAATKSVSSGNALSLADAKKVLVISKYYHSLSDIVNGAFSVPAKIGTGVALIFLDADNHYIGNFSSRGLNVLPLGNLKDGDNTSIDLSSLTLVGTNVIPAHDPFGNEINITDDEINCLQKIGGFYESIAKNIDADNDGVPDVLTNSEIMICTHYNMNVGHWGLNTTPPVLTDTTHYYVNYGIEFEGGSALTFSNGNVALAGPSDSPYTDIIRWGFMMAPDCSGGRGFIASFNRLGVPPPDYPLGNNFMPFKDGTYTLTLDGNKSYTLNYSCVDVKFNLINIIPTLHTNTDGKVTSITFEYRLTNGKEIPPSNILTEVAIGMEDNSTYQFYFSQKRLTAETGFTVFTPDAPIDISTLYKMYVDYDDLLGNTYVLTFK